jgi:hypothetical protein
MSVGWEGNHLPDKQNSRPPTGIAPRLGVGYRSSKVYPPPRRYYECDKGSTVATLRFILLTLF